MTAALDAPSYPPLAGAVLAMPVNLALRHGRLSVALVVRLEDGPEAEADALNRAATEAARAAVNPVEKLSPLQRLVLKTATIEPMHAKRIAAACSTCRLFSSTRKGPLVASPERALEWAVRLPLA